MPQKTLDLSLPAELLTSGEVNNTNTAPQQVFDPRLQQAITQVRQQAANQQAAAKPHIQSRDTNHFGQQQVRVGDQCFEVTEADLLDENSFQTWAFTDCPADLKN